MTITSKLLAAILALVAWASPAAATPLSVSTITPGSLKDVDTSDGVDESEARIIAEAYFHKHIGCGTYEGVTESSDSWVVEGKFGYTGDPISGFLRNKKTGQITSPIGPSYTRPNDMLLLEPNNSFMPKLLRSAA